MNTTKYVIKSLSWAYLKDIDNTKNIIWTEKLEEAAILSEYSELDRAIYKGVKEILDKKGIGYYQKFIIISEKYEE